MLHSKYKILSLLLTCGSAVISGILFLLAPLAFQIVVLFWIAASSAGVTLLIIAHEARTLDAKHEQAVKLGESIISKHDTFLTELANKEGIIRMNNHVTVLLSERCRSYETEIARLHEVIKELEE